MHLRSIILRFS